MAVLDILIYPDARLQTKAKPVENITDTHLKQLDDMLETMYKDNGIGLAGTQVDIHERMFVMDTSISRESPLFLINPEIIEAGPEVEMDEGCLSVPGVYTKIKRPSTVKIKYLDKTGTEQHVELADIEARCVLHELDHLDGITFMDHLSPLKRKMAMKKLQKAKAALAQ